MDRENENKQAQCPFSLWIRALIISITYCFNENFVSAG